MHVQGSYRALKLRVGDTPLRDIHRVRAVREALGEGIEIMVDANTGYCLEDVCRVMPAFDDYGVFWLEEPFPAHDYRDYKIASTLGRVPLAAGENHFTRFESKTAPFALPNRTCQKLAVSLRHAASRHSVQHGK